jgi:hypothetical protein
MIKHIVLWKLKKNAEGATAEENGKRAVADFDALRPKIPYLVSIESGLDFNRSGAAWDLGLVTTFKTREDLDLYQNQPDHVKIKGFLGKVAEDRCVVDFEY